MNRTRSFEWDLNAHTHDSDDADLLVFGLDPRTFGSRTAIRPPPAERA